MEIKLWDGFSKRYNSTKQPNDASAITKNVRLKEDTSIDSPVFILNDTNFNYSYVKAFGNYYFVTQIIALTNTQIEVRCEKDVLATYKAQILSTSAYVLFHTHANTELSDKRLGAKTTKSISENHASFNTLGQVSSADSIVVASIIGESTVGNYAMSQASVTELMNNFDNWYDESLVWPENPDISQATDFVEGLKYVGKTVVTSYECLKYFLKQLMNTGSAPDKVKNAIMLPLAINDITGTTESIKLGKYESDTSGVRITNRIFADAVTVTIPWQASDWRRNAPYHELYLYLPYIGVVEISPSDIMGDESITIRAVVDTITGDTVFTVRTDTYHFIGQYNTNIATNYPIGNSNVTPASAVTTLATLGASVGATIATGGVGAILPATAGIVGIANQMASQGTSIGSNSGAAAYGLSSQVHVYSVYHDTVATPSSVSDTIGTPTNKVMSLSSITGYVQTSAISVDCDAESPEKQKINGMVDGGIFIE